MKNTRITLAKIYFSERMSEETNCFTANVLFDGKLTGIAENRGHGGCTSIFAYSAETVDALREMEKYAESLPKIKFEGFGTRGAFEIDSDLEHVVDTLFEDWLEVKHQAKIQKKLEKDCLNAICVGDTVKGYEMISWTSNKQKVAIRSMLETPNGLNAIKIKIMELKANGEKILNKNIPATLLK